MTLNFLTFTMYICVQQKQRVLEKKKNLVYDILLIMLYCHKVCSLFASKLSEFEAVYTCVDVSKCRFRCENNILK